MRMKFWLTRPKDCGPIPVRENTTSSTTSMSTWSSSSAQSAPDVGILEKNGVVARRVVVAVFGSFLLLAVLGDQEVYLAAADSFLVDPSECSVPLLHASANRAQLRLRRYR